MVGRTWACALAFAALAFLGDAGAQAPENLGDAGSALALDRATSGVWRIGGDRNVAVFAEQRAVAQGQEGAVRMWSTWVLRTPQATAFGRMKYFVALYEYDCTGRRLRILRITTYESEGRALESDSTGSLFEDAAPESLNERTLLAACARFSAWPSLGAQRISDVSREPIDLAAYADIDFASSRSAGE